MSAAAAVDRVEQIRAMLAALAGPTPAATPSTSSFASTLNSATATAASTSPVAATGTGGGQSSQYDALIDAAAQRHGVDPALLRALIRQESGFNANARSSAGAVGLTQLMPATAAALGVKDPTDPAQSIEGGATYLRQQLDRFGGDVSKALAAYNAGPGAVEKYNGVPPYPETQSYVQRILAYRQEYQGATTSASATGATPSAASAGLTASPLLTAALGVAEPSTTTTAPAAPTGLSYSTI